MKFRLYREHGALNSPPVFDAFEQGIKKLGFSVDQDPGSIPVIWSVLWQGRMKPNLQIYNRSQAKNTPTIIIEVGNFHRGHTWRISTDNVNRLGYFGEGPIDHDRHKKIKVDLLPSRSKRGPDILIACQHRNSLQWPSNLTIESWIELMIKQIRSRTDRKIVVRPHPRCPISLTAKDLTIERPKKLINTYDDYDFNHDYHAVINHNTGPSVQAAMMGTPVICDQTGLAYPVSDQIENIENPCLGDRQDWLIDLCHKEWTTEEIAQGIPLRRLLPYLESKIS